MCSIKKDSTHMRLPVSRPLRRAILLVVYVCTLSTITFSQEITETRWYFGNTSAGLIFDQNGRDVRIQDDQALPFGAAGAATITDQFTGNLLFYTDGTRLFDASHTLMSAGLSGSASINVPVVTCPVAGNEGTYYLFTNSGSSGVNEIQQTQVNANQVGNGTGAFPLGDITVLNTSTGLTNPSEGMLIVPSGDGTLFWLISQDRISFQIRVTQIDNGGIGATTSYDFTDGSTPGAEAAHFAFNADSAKLAMAPRTTNRNIWLMDFDPLTGILNFDRSLTGTGFNDGSTEAVYDVEWSADGSKLYFSRFGGAASVGQVYQIDFNDVSETVRPVLATPLFRSFGLKRAIDDRIYHLYQEVDATSPYLLGRINRPDSTIDSVFYEPQVFTEDFQAQQFPEFTAGYNFTFDTLSFYWIDSCETNVTKFFPIVDPVPNQIFWDFGDGNMSDQWIPNHTYDVAGGYTVSMTATVGGISQTLSQPVEILTNDLMVDLGQDTTICPDEILTLDAGTGTSFVWSTGETTQTIDVDTTGTYWVEVTTGNGCTDFDDIEVLEYGVTEQIFNQWYFGERAGIDFNNGPIAILDGNNQDATEGCATISDVNGDLLFYTNGVTIWNREHEVMVNGDSIGGDQASAQNALIMPFSGDETLFYVFTTEQVYGDEAYALHYAIVDMKGDTARGEVTIKDVKLVENSTERITGSGFTGNDLIIAHDFGNNTFRSFQTGPFGLSHPIFSPIGEVHAFTNEDNATGYMKISPNFNSVAVNIPGASQIEIFDLQLGVVDNPRLIDTGESGLYGLEFSPSGNRLYVTTDTELIQYDLDSLNGDNAAVDIAASKFDGYAAGVGYGALQTGPDGQIYMAVDNSGTVGVISAPDGDDAASNFDPAGFDLQGRTSRRGLPNFAQVENSPTQEPAIAVTAACAGQESTFTAVGRDPNNSIENYLWIFGDGTFADVQDTTHIYTSPGTYTVQMVLSNRCDIDTTLSTTITINNLPETPTVPSDTALCGQPIVLEAWATDNADFSYFWSTGDTSRQITVTQPSIIDVAIINEVTGCTSDTLSIFVADARPQVLLGEDLTVCLNDSVAVLDASVVNAISFSWTINGAAAGTNRTQEVDTSVPGTFEYVIEVENSFNCTNADTLVLTVLEGASASPLSTETTGCGNSDGFIQLSFGAAGSYSYEITGPENRGPFSVDGPATVTLPAGAVNPGDGDLPAGSYTLITTDLVSGCTQSEAVTISDPGTFNFTVAPTGNCPSGVTLTLSNTPADFSYTILDEAGIEAVPSGSNQTVFTNLDPGTYNVQISDNAAPNCIETEQITIVAGSEPALSFDAIQAFCSATGFVEVTDGGTAGTTYTWSTIDGNILTSPASGTSVEVNQSGTYTLTASAPGFCDRVEDIAVQFNAAPTVSFITSGDPCEGQLDLVAEVSGGSGTFIYEWTDGSQAAQNTIATSGTYAVTVTDQLTGCVASSAPLDIEVFGEFTVQLDLSSDCSDNGQVLLIATPNYSDPAITYAWRDGGGNLLFEVDSILTVTSSDDYTVTVTNETGTCTASDVRTVAVLPINPEDLLLPERASFCSIDPSNPTAVLDPGVFNTYEWRLLPDPSIISSEPTLTVMTAGNYEVTLYNGSTCITDQVEVVDDCRPVILAPNAFSPNGNGINETFYVIPNDAVDAFEILIYTRWGELIYRATTIDFQWDGVYKGERLPPGTYAYIMKFSSSVAPDIGTIEQYGSVTLVR